MVVVSGHSSNKAWTRASLRAIVLNGMLLAAGEASAEDLAAKFPNLVIPVPPVVADDEELAAEPAPERRPGFDLADRFPNIVMPPMLAASEADTAERGGTTARVPGYSDFATIVEEAKREAMGLPALGARSLSDGLKEASRAKVQAQFASHARPHCRAGGRSVPASPCPPQQRQMQPQQPLDATQPPLPMQPEMAAESGDALVPGSTDQQVSPLPQVPPAVVATPDLRRELPRSNQLARADIGGLRENWADIPNLVGDGCAPMGSSGQIAVGRLGVQALDQSLVGSGTGSFLTGSTSRDIVLVQNPNSQQIQTIAPQYPGYAGLPGTPVGSVSSSTPIPVTSHGAILGVGSPGSFTQSVDQVFKTNAAVGTTQYTGATTAFDAPASGAVGQAGNGQAPYDAYLFYNYVVSANIVLPGYAVGFVKLTENMSPIPRDRVYMTYSYFNNANFYPTKADANRFMPGFEKTFFDGWTSVELRTPFAATLSNSQNLLTNTGNGQSGVSEYRDIQFGNMSVIFKTFLWEQKTWAITAGTQVMLPTANNTSVTIPGSQRPDGQNLQMVYVANESVHVMPFVGSVWAPNERWFNQALLQIETDVNGNLAYINNSFDPTLSGRQLQQAGRIYYPTFMYLSFGTGYWLYKDNTRNFTGFSPVAEIHVNQALDEFCPRQSNGFQLGPNLGIVSVTNAMVGCNFEWGERSTLTFGYVTPLGGGVDRYFDGELRALYNWRFGPQNRLTRAQF